MASQKQAQYHFLPSCDKYLDKQATDQGSLEREREREREREILHV